MADPQAIPIGSRIVEALRDPDGRLHLRQDPDQWPPVVVDPAVDYQRFLRGHVHDLRLLASTKPDEPVLAIVNDATDSFYVELDPLGMPIVASAEGLEAVRVADRLQSSPEPDLDDEQAESIVALATDEGLELRFALFARLHKWLSRHSRTLPVTLFGLLPWEFLDARIQAALEALEGRATTPRPIPTYYFRDAAPSVLPAVARIDSAARESALRPSHLARLREAIADLPGEHNLPQQTLELLLRLAEAAEERLQVERPEPPEPGQIRALWSAAPLLDEEIGRLAAVIATLPEESASLVALITNEVEFATHRDLRLEPDETGLDYPILLETDLVIPVWNSQLGDPIGHIAPQFSSFLVPRPDLNQAPEDRLGFDLAGPWDSRWAWKERELDQLQRLGSACYAALSGLAREVDYEGAVVEPTVGLALTADVAVEVALLNAASRLRVSWTRGDVESESLARGILARALADAEVQSNLTRLAFAEARFAAHRVGLWTIDSALASIALIEQLSLRSAADAPSGLHQLLHERLPQAVDALVELSPIIHDPEAIDILRDIEDELGRSRDWMDPAVRERFDGFIDAYVVWDFVWSELPRQVSVHTLAAESREVAVSPELVLAGVVDDDARLRLEPAPGDPDTLKARLELSSRVTNAVRTQRRVEHAPELEHGQEEAAALLVAAVGGGQPIEGWLQVFDSESGAIVRSVQLQLEDTAAGARLCLAAEVPSELFTKDGHGAIAVRRPHDKVDPDRAIGLICAAAIVKPAVSGDFARLLAREFTDQSVKTRLLRTAEAAFRLSGEGEDADLGDRPSMVAAQLELLDPGGRPAEFPPEATAAATARFFRYAATEWHAILDEVAFRLDFTRFRELPASEEADAVGAALEDSADFLVSLRGLRALLP